VDDAIFGLVGVALGATITGLTTWMVARKRAEVELAKERMKLARSDEDRRMEAYVPALQCCFEMVHAGPDPPPARAREIPDVGRHFAVVSLLGSTESMERFQEFLAAYDTMVEALRLGATGEEHRRCREAAQLMLEQLRSSLQADLAHDQAL